MTDQPVSPIPPEISAALIRKGALAMLDALPSSAWGGLVMASACFAIECTIRAMPEKDRQKAADMVISGFQSKDWSRAP